MVPRCTIRMEKCSGGMKMVCTCDDEVAARDAEPVQDAGRQHVQLLLHLERHDDVPCNLLANCQCRNDQGRLLHHLHQR